MADYSIQCCTKVAISLIFGIFIVNTMCSVFLGIDIIDSLKRLISRMTDKNEKDED